MATKTVYLQTCDDLILRCERLLKQNLAKYHDCIKQQEILRLEFLGTSSDYKYLRTWLDIAYRDMLTSESKYGNLTQHYKVLLKNNIVTKFLDYANDQETLQMKLIETMHQCNDIKADLDTLNKRIESFKLQCSDLGAHLRGFAKREETLRLKLVENINECERLKSCLNATHKRIIMLNPEHDGLTRRFRVLFGNNIVQEFVHCAKYQEKLQLTLKEKCNECEFTNFSDQSNNSVASLRFQLAEIRQMLNMERLLLERIEKERSSFDYLSDGLCSLLFKSRRLILPENVKQQCLAANEKLQKSINEDSRSFEYLNAVNKFDSNILKTNINELHISHDNFESLFNEDENEPTTVEEENTGVNRPVSTELEFSFSDEDYNSDHTSNSDQLSVENLASTTKKSDVALQSEVSTLSNFESSEHTGISHASQFSILESPDELSNDRILDNTEETMPASNTNEIVPDIVNDLQTQNISNLSCEIFRRDNSNMCELKKHNCIACERLKLFKCNECNQMFTRRDAMQLHISQVHEQIENFYDCAYCDKRFINQKASLEFHIFTKHSEKFDNPYKCTICDASFVKRYLLNFHIAENHDPDETSSRSKSSEIIQKSPAFQTSVSETTIEQSNDLIADYEGSVSTSNSNEVVPESVANLQTQQLISNLCCDIFRQDYPEMCVLKEFNCIACERLKLFKCNNCSQMFAREDVLRSHVSQVHEPNKVHFDCAHCGKRYMNQRRNLLKHIFTKHSEKFDKPYKCTICGASFAVEFLLTGHKDEKHGSVKNSGKPNQPELLYHCEKCKKSFTPKDSSQRPVKCSTCNYSVVKNSSKRSPRSKLSCDICGQNFARKNLLNRHKTYVHGGKKRFKCPTCGKRFARNDSLTEHKFMHSTVRPFKCSVCGMDFKSSSHMKKHKKRQHKEYLSHKCNVCGKSFSRKDYLKSHAVVHSSLKPFKCPICDRAFKLSWEVKKHKKIVHEGEVLPYRFSCAHCEKQFYQRSALAEHIHTKHFSGSLEVKKYQCTECDKSFFWPAALKVHQITHMTERPYKCSICNDSFKRAHTRDKHEKRFHTEGVRFRSEHCDICQRNFCTKSDLRSHIQYMHEKKSIKCEECDKMFATKTALNKHLPSHSTEKRFKCSTCSISFKYLQSKKLHERKVHEKNFSFCCAHCDKKFYVKREISSHMEIHHLPRLKRKRRNHFFCAYCNKKLLTRGSIIRHIRSHHLPEFKDRFKCKFCNQAYALKYQLKAHELRHTSQGRGKGSVRDKPLHQRDQRAIYERRGRRKDVGFQCAHCDEHYFQKRTIVRHLQTRHSLLFK